jgi:hypothetical protein
MPAQGRNRGQITAIGQTAMVAATHWALGAGWGDSTKALTTGANDVAGEIVVTAVTGGGLAQATATLTATFTSAYAAAPRVVIVTMWNDNDVTTQFCCKVSSISTTGFVITCPTIPVNTKIYHFNYLVVA